MLVLSRKMNEKIKLDVEGLEAPIEVTVVKIDKNKVRIGIEADRKVIVVRSELTDNVNRVAG
jgi:carbon storage regulator CsrA